MESVLQTQFIRFVLPELSFLSLESFKHSVKEAEKGIWKKKGNPLTCMDTGFLRGGSLNLATSGFCFSFCLYLFVLLYLVLCLIL